MNKTSGHSTMTLSSLSFVYNFRWLSQNLEFRGRRGSQVEEARCILSKTCPMIRGNFVVLIPAGPSSRFVSSHCTQRCEASLWGFIWLKVFLKETLTVYCTKSVKFPLNIIWIELSGECDSNHISISIVYIIMEVIVHTPSDLEIS